MAVDLDKVKNIISEQLGVDVSEITPESHFIDDLGADFSLILSNWLCS